MFEIRLKIDVQHEGDIGFPKSCRRGFNDEDLLKIMILSSLLPKAIRSDYYDILRERVDSYDLELHRLMGQLQSKFLRDKKFARASKIIDDLYGIISAQTMTVIHDSKCVLRTIYSTVEKALGGLNEKERDMALDVINSLLKWYLENIYMPLEPLIDIVRKELLNVIGQTKLYVEENNVVFEMPIYPYANIIEYRRCQMRGDIFCTADSEYMISWVKIPETGFVELFFGFEDMCFRCIDSSVHSNRIILSHEFETYVFLTVAIGTHGRVLFFNIIRTPAFAPKYGGEIPILTVISPLEIAIELNDDYINKAATIAKSQVTEFFELMERETPLTTSLMNCFNNLKEIKKVDVKDTIFLYSSDILSLLYAVNQDLVSDYLMSYYMGLGLFLEELRKFVGG